MNKTRSVINEELWNFIYKIKNNLRSFEKKRKVLRKVIKIWHFGVIIFLCWTNLIWQHFFVFLLYLIFFSHTHTHLCWQTCLQFSDLRSVVLLARFFFFSFPFCLIKNLYFFIEILIGYTVFFYYEIA